MVDSPLETGLAAGGELIEARATLARYHEDAYHEDALPGRRIAKEREL